MFQMARDPPPGARTPTGTRTASVLRIQYLITLFLKKTFCCFSTTPSVHQAVLDISLTGAITGPKFPFHKNVTTSCEKNELPLNLRIYVCNIYIYVRVYLSMVNAKQCSEVHQSQRLVREIALRKLFC
uniref:Uncharacterized protein n=1 Tax=Pipistrellus kuhlii TaxID=59472 RepID=A0A7J7VMG2_PIPKU|nr:hypothetical protein mPipKuh1_008410 [Pipistrellus kuhlii]